MRKIDLNDLRIVTDSGEQSLTDFSVKVDNPYFDNVEVILRDAEKRLIELINQHKDGAIFWLHCLVNFKAYFESTCKM